MIQLSRNYSLPERQDDIIPIKVIGVGGAGSNALDRIVLDGLEKADLVAANTDAQSLASSVAAHKVQLGRECARAASAPGAIRSSATTRRSKSADEIAAESERRADGFRVRGFGRRDGLGRGAGDRGIGAREQARWWSVLRRCRLLSKANAAPRKRSRRLARLHEHSDAVICFENDKMGDMVAPKAGIHQAFAAADMTISQSVRSIVNLIQRPGLIRYRLRRSSLCSAQSEWAVPVWLRRIRDRQPRPRRADAGAEEPA